MRYAREHKGETKARIVDAASALFRRKGIDAVGIASVMEAAAMTHGGFYAHFDSKEALIREGILAAESGYCGRASRRRCERAARVRARAHHRSLSFARASRSSGDGLRHPRVRRRDRATLETDAQRLHAARARAMLGLLGDFAETPEREATALGVMATLVGALSLARAVDDPELADAFLREGRRAAQALASARP